MKTAILADTGTQLLPSCFLYVPTRGQPRADVALDLWGVEHGAVAGEGGVDGPGLLAAEVQGSVPVLDEVSGWMFVIRLSHSGRAFHVGFATQAQEAFLEGRVLAFAHFGAVPARIRYDNRCRSRDSVSSKINHWDLRGDPAFNVFQRPVSPRSRLGSLAS